MAKTIWNAADRQALESRIDAITPSRKPLWGKMSASQMVRHCTVAFFAATGEISITPKKTLFGIWPFQKLIIYVLPWPKGAPTAPEFIIPDDGDFDERRAELRATIEKFVSKGETQSFQPHAAFGPLSPADWGALMHRHLDHHLTQFGV